MWPRLMSFFLCHFTRSLSILLIFLKNQFSILLIFSFSFFSFIDLFSLWLPSYACFDFLFFFFQFVKIGAGVSVWSLFSLLIKPFNTINFPPSPNLISSLTLIYFTQFLLISEYFLIFLRTSTLTSGLFWSVLVNFQVLRDYVAVFLPLLSSLILLLSNTLYDFYSFKSVKTLFLGLEYGLSWRPLPNAWGVCITHCCWVLLVGQIRMVAGRFISSVLADRMSACSTNYWETSV